MKYSNAIWIETMCLVYSDRNDAVNAKLSDALRSEFMSHVL